MHIQSGPIDQSLILNWQLIKIFYFFYWKEREEGNSGIFLLFKNIFKILVIRVAKLGKKTNSQDDLLFKYLTI